jgi:acyl-CoA thioester hydrolase
MKELITTYQGIVYPWHCDHMGHMNVMWYVGKFDEATWKLAALCGVTTTYMKRENRGMVAAEQRILYKRELLAGTIVSVRTGIIEVGEKKMKFFHEMINDETGEVAAITFLTGVHIDSLLRRACPLPEEFRKLAEGYVTGNVPQV